MTLSRSAPDGPIHEWFGLSYANFLALPRTLLQSMPLEWQEKFVACLGEYDDYWRGCELEPPGGYRVQPIDENGRFSSAWPVPHYERGRTLLEPELSERGTRIITAAQWRAGYVEKIGNAVYSRPFEKIAKLGGGNYLVFEPEPEKPLYRLDGSDETP